MGQISQVDLVCRRRCHSVHQLESISSVAAGDEAAESLRREDPLASFPPDPSVSPTDEMSTAGRGDESGPLGSEADASVPPTASMGGAAASALYSGVPPPKSWPRRSMTSAASQHSSKSDLSSSSQLQSRRSSERPNQSSMMTSMSSLSSCTLPVPPRNPGRDVRYDSLDRGVSPAALSPPLPPSPPLPLSPPLQSAVPRRVLSAGHASPMPSAKPSPRRAGGALEPPMQPPNDVPAQTVAAAARGAPGRVTPAGPLGEGVSRVASDDDLSESAWQSEATTRASSPAHAPAGEAHHSRQSSGSTSEAPSASQRGSAMSQTHAVPLLGLPQATDGPPTTHEAPGRGPATPTGRAVDDGRPQHDAPPAVAPLLKTVSAPPRNGEVRSEPQEEEGDELAGMRSRHPSVRRQRHVVNVYTMHGSGVSPRPGTDSGPKTDRTGQLGNAYSALDAPLSAPSKSARSSSVPSNATRAPPHRLAFMPRCYRQVRHGCEAARVRRERLRAVVEPGLGGLVGASQVRADRGRFCQRMLRSGRCGRGDCRSRGGKGGTLRSRAGAPVRWCRIHRRVPVWSTGGHACCAFSECCCWCWCWWCG